MGQQQLQLSVAGPFTFDRRLEMRHLAAHSNQPPLEHRGMLGCC